MQLYIPWGKIKALEEEIKALKSLGKKPTAKKSAKHLSIEGMLKGVKVTEKDFQEAKRMIFNDNTVNHLLYQKHKK